MGSIEMRCPECQATNRLPEDRLHDRPSCGRCHRPLFGGTPVSVDDASFADHVERFPLPVLVDFWATWCPPCRLVAPVLEELARTHAGRLRVAKVDIDRSPQLAARFQIRSVPTLAIFDRGRLVDQVAGALPKAELQRWLEQRLTGSAGAAPGPRRPQGTRQDQGQPRR